MVVVGQVAQAKAMAVGMCGPRRDRDAAIWHKSRPSRKRKLAPAEGVQGFLNSTTISTTSPPWPSVRPSLLPSRSLPSKMSPWSAFPCPLHSQTKLIHNPPPQRSYAPGSAERKSLVEALAQMEQELPFEVPCIVNGKEVSPVPTKPASLISRDRRATGQDGQAREAASPGRSCQPPLYLPRSGSGYGRGCYRWRPRREKRLGGPSLERSRRHFP